MTTEAWVLKKANEQNELSKESFEIGDLSAEEVLLKPLFGCLEGNMVHALTNDPIDILKERQEEKIILGNAGVMEVIEAGKIAKSKFSAGDKVIYFCNGKQDEYGYPLEITGYDKKGSMGVLAKKIKLTQDEIIKIPDNSSVSLEQWAAFSLKFITAWSNWKVAYNTWKIQMPQIPNNEIYVFGWGGGVTYAELLLAKKMGCTCTMITSKKENIELCKKNNINVFNRSIYSKEKFEDELSKYIKHITKNKLASIFIDNIGKDVYKSTMKSIGRQGIITTSGWKTGGMLPVLRQNECLNRHVHVHTHYAKQSEGEEAINYAIVHNWIPPVCKTVYEWDEIPKLIEDYKQGTLETYFPIFKIN